MPVFLATGEAMSNEINWRSDLDDDDNTFWEGNSPYTDGEDGPRFKWRLRPRLEGNRIIWYACHDQELGGQDESWLTILAAKRACQEAHDNIVAEIQSEAHP